MELLEVTADGDALGDISAVVEFQHRHSGDGIFLAKLLAAIHLVADIDLLVRNFDSLLRKEHPAPPWIRRVMALENSHDYSFIKPPSWARAVHPPQSSTAAQT